MRLHTMAGRGLLLAVVLMALSSSAYAAIGIYNWHPVSSDPSATINYRINTDADSGTILIKNSVTNAVVKTITLTAPQMTKGAHSVIWLGDKDTGGSAPSADYYAVITVHAPAVVEDALNKLKNRHDYANVTGKYYGVAVDTNPANNDQANPANSTYGLLYASDALTTPTKKIEVFYPDVWTDTIGASPSIQPTKTVFSSFTVGGSSPWGVSVGADGRVYSSDRSNAGSIGFHNYAPDGSGHVWGKQDTNSQDMWAYGKVADGTAWHYRSLGASLERVSVNPDFSYADLNGADVNKVAQTVITGILGTSQQGIFGLTGGPNATLNSPLWITVFATTDTTVKSVQKWNWDGVSGYVVDPSWTMTADASGPMNLACGLDICPKQLPLGAGGAMVNVLAVGVQRSTNNLVLLNADTGEFLKAYSPSAAMIHNVKWDAVGNVFCDVSGGSRSNKQPVVSVFFPEDAGSSDTRSTIAFHHTQGNTPPSAANGLSTKVSIKEDDTDSTDLTVEVTDLDGVANIDTVTVSLWPLGYSATQAMTLDANLSSTTNRYKVTGVKAKPSTRAGLLDLVVTVKDKGLPPGVGTPGTGTTTIPLEIVGGTLSGTIKHKDAAFPITGATVSLTESTSGNVYTATTSAVAGLEGTYTAAVNPGTYTVHAAKPGTYGTGVDPSGVTVAQDESKTAPDATLGSVTCATAKTASDGTIVCVEGFAVAQPAAADWATGGQKGFWDDDANLNNIKWYIRDASTSGPPVVGFKVDDATNKPVRGDVVVVEGKRLYNNGYERHIQQVLHYYNKGAGADTLTPEVTTLSTLTQDSLNLDYTDWGRYIQVNDCTVVAGSQSAAGTDFLTFKVNDASTATAWDVKVWKSLGAVLADLPGDGASITLKGVVARRGFYLTNGIEPTAMSDLLQAPIHVASAGAARSKAAGTRVIIDSELAVSKATSSDFWVQDKQRSAGIRVVSTANPAVDTLVTLPVGILKLDAVTQEKYLDIESGSVTTGTSFTVVPLGTGNKNVGGNKVTDGKGLPDDGLYVKVWGKFISEVFDANTGNVYLYVDDGSGATNDTADPGIKVLKDGGPGLGSGDYVTVTGVVTLADGGGGKVIRMILPRDGSFIVKSN